MSRKQVNKRPKTLGNRANRWSKMQAEARHPSSKRQVKQQRQQHQRQRRLNIGFIFNLRIWREFRFIQFVYHCQKYPKENM